jgi:hypothetical protein
MADPLRGHIKRPTGLRFLQDFPWLQLLGRGARWPSVRSTDYSSVS